MPRLPLMQVFYPNLVVTDVEVTENREPNSSVNAAKAKGISKKVKTSTFLGLSLLLKKILAILTKLSLVFQRDILDNFLLKIDKNSLINVSTFAKLYH